MKTHKFLILCSLMVLATVVFACGSPPIVRGSGDLVTESREVSNFDRVDLSGAGEVRITQGASESLTVETDDNIMQYVSTQVRGGTLVIGLDTQGLQAVTATKLLFTLNLVNLEGVSISGSGSVLADAIDTDTLEVDVSGSGDLRIDSLTAGKTDVQISGSGEVELAGESPDQDVRISGSGKYHGKDLQGESVRANVSGSGNATVWVTGSLDASVSGSGSVDYYGDPPMVNSSESGSGTINSRGAK